MHSLFNSPQLIEEVFAGLQDGFTILDKNHVTTYVNDAFVKMVGFERDELIGLSPPFPCWPKEELDKIYSTFQRGVAGARQTFEVTFCKKDGTRFPISVSPSVLKDASGEAIAHIATFRDLSERTHLKETQYKSEQRWRSIAENPFDFVVIINRDYKYIYINHTAPGISKESILGKMTPLDFTDSANHPKMIAAFEAAFNNGQASYYDVYISQLDQWFSTFVGPIWENGVVNSISLLTRDITQQKRNEEAYRQSEIKLRESHKMETVGTLAGGIAHDLNNILTPILAHGDLALQKIDIHHPIYNSIISINDATLRARDLVQRILLFSRRHEAQKTLFDLNALVSESVTLFRASAPSSIAIHVNVHTEPIWIYADRVQINQVLANLVTNALQAMNTCGNCLHLQVAPSEVQENEIADAKIATIIVTDNGIGMDEETKRRAFDPFYTTKALGTGTGLGLSIVHGIVREHDGSVHINTALGNGTTITIRLPCGVHNNDNQSKVSKIDYKINTIKPVRVLCVDDEPTILEVLKLGLSQNGHHITTTLHAKEAHSLLTQNASDYDILITDQTMPFMMGTELVAALRKDSIAIPCILMTGFDDEKTVKHAQVLNINEILLKPFSFADLFTAIHKTLTR